VNALSTTKPPLPEWLNRARPLVGAVLIGVPVYLVFLLYAGGSPQTTDVGYMPGQPVAYSHQVHVGKMGMDCRYCHTTVETAAFAAVPPTAVCMNCHKTIAPDAESIEPLRRSMKTGKPVPWVRVHDLPDYVYFDHHAHIGRGVACVSCHGRVDRMEQVYQAERLSMGWCLECHRDPAPKIRPVEFVTDMNWVPDEDAQTLGQRLMKEHNISPSTDCSACHR
jgi:menaquinone reductase, multiheme cytochrome c subunit